MKLKKIITVITCLFCLPLFADIEKPIVTHESEMAKAQMIHFLDGFRSYFESQYACIEWKKESLGWDLDLEVEKAKEKVLSQNLTIQDFRKVIKEIANSTQDWHVGVTFYSTEASFLPFEVKKAGERYFITYVSKLVKFPIQIGDEIVTFDAKPIQVTIDEIKAFNRYTRKTETEQSKAEIYLTLRLGIKAYTVPKGIIQIGVKHRGSEKIKIYPFEWGYIPELIKKDTDLSLITKDPFPKKEEYSLKMMDPFFDEIKQREELTLLFGGSEEESQLPIRKAEDPNASETRKSYLPDLGKKIWHSDATSSWEKDGHFYAYIYQNAKGQKIGYIHIATYDPPSIDDAIKEFGALIDRMQNQTDALVIDQLNNPGGFILYAWGLSSMLTPKELKMPTFRFKVTPEDIMGAQNKLKKLKGIQSEAQATLTYGAHMYGLPVNLELIKRMRSYNQFLIDQWEKGKNITDPTYYFAYDTLKPHPKYHYTKPILFLINGLGISCADFVPAILQDNKVATLFGSTTSGAGGSVDSFIAPFNKYGVSNISMTVSLLERTNKEKIENRGVHPDIWYQLTENDLLHNYSEQVNAINQAVNALITK